MIKTNLISDNIEAASYDVERLRELIPDWDDLSSTEKLEVLEDIDPDSRVTTHNVITQTYRQHIAEVINPEVSTTAVDVTHMAFGNDDTATDVSDTHLVNEVYRDNVDDHVTQSAEEAYSATTLIQSDEAVGLDLQECALVTEASDTNADDLAVNRALLSDSRLQPKDGDSAVTVTITITYLDESEAV